MRDLVAKVCLVLAALTLVFVNDQARSQPGTAHLARVLPSGFMPLSMPRQNIPIGAVWRPGIGPDGPGVDVSNISTTQSIARLTSAQTRSGGLQAALAQYLGLTGAAVDDLSVELSHLQVSRVADLQGTSASSGQSILYEGIRAGEITLRYRSGIDATIRGAVQARGLQVTASGGAGSQSQLSLDGSGLFIGYRVVEIRSVGQPQRTRRRIDRDGSGRLGPYDLDLNFGDVADCMCRSIQAGPTTLQGSVQRMNACHRQYPTQLRVANYQQTTISGDIYERRFSIGYEPSPFRVALGSVSDGDETTIDTLNVLPIVYHGWQERLNICIPSMDSGSYFELVRSRYRLTNVANSQAPGW